jgi:hypothetical protein
MEKQIEEFTNGANACQTQDELDRFCSKNCRILFNPRLFDTLNEVVYKVRYSIIQNTGKY